MDIILDQDPVLLKAYGRALKGRKKALRDGETIPRIVISRRGLSVDRTLAAAYARVCELPEGVAVTFPHVLAAPIHLELITLDAFPVAALGSVHVAQQMRWTRRLRVGDRLDLEVSVDGHRLARKGVEFDILTRFTAAGGDELVWEATTTVLAPSKRHRDPEAPTVEEPGADTVWDTRTPWVIPGDQGRRYAKVSLDYNPIHLFAASAKLFGFKRQIAHGMWAVGRATGDLVPTELQSRGQMDVAFRRPIFLPTTAELVRGGDGRFALTRGDGKVHFFGEVSEL